MSNKVKNIVTTFAFVTFIAFFAVLCVMRIFDPVTRLEAERRDAAQLPQDFTVEQLLDNKEYVNEAGVVMKAPIKQFEDFTVEQFPFRQFFRNLKVTFAMDILNIKENNGYVKEEGSIATVKSEYSEEELERLGRRLALLATLYQDKINGKNGNAYLAIVPDKNYYLGKDYGYVMPDYEALVEQVTEALPEMKYIDLFGSLSLTDYYKTDWHWDQSKLVADAGVLDTLAEGMGFADRLSGEYTENVLEGFSGSYMGALPADPETLIYLTNDALDGCELVSYDAMGFKEIRTELYFHDVFHNTESYPNKVDYDFFMNGRCGIQRIENPNATTDKELIVFRDSFGANLLPLMAEGYKTIYSVDLRDTPVWSLGMLNFEGKDVLFLFSTTVLVDQEDFKK